MELFLVGVNVALCLKHKMGSFWPPSCIACKMEFSGHEMFTIKADLALSVLWVKCCSIQYLCDLCLLKNLWTCELHSELISWGCCSSWWEASLCCLPPSTQWVSFLGGDNKYHLLDTVNGCEWQWSFLLSLVLPLLT